MAAPRHPRKPKQGRRARRRPRTDIERRLALLEIFPTRVQQVAVAQVLGKQERPQTKPGLPSVGFLNRPTLPLSPREIEIAAAAKAGKGRER
jgi:hypothetical protein